MFVKVRLTHAIFVAQLNVIFVALKLQPAAILAQFVSTGLFRKQKLCACSKAKLLLKNIVFRELHLKQERGDKFH